MKQSIRAWFKHQAEWIPVLISQAGNVIFYMGHPDETISARAHRSAPRDAVWARRRERINRRWNRVARWPIFRRFMKPSDDHCFDSFADDLQRAGQILSWHGYNMRRVSEPVPEIDMVDV